MKTVYKTGLLVMALLLPSLITSAQTFENLYDGDTTFDEGDNIFIKPDNSYFIIGNAQKDNFQYLQLMSMVVAADGSHKISTHLFNFGRQQCFTGLPGTGKQLQNGNYLTPICLQSASNIGRPHLNSFGGLAKFKPNGDTVFVKLYNDTNDYFCAAYNCAELPDGGYLLAGAIDTITDTTNNNSGLLIRTDSNGNKLWQRTYLKIPNIQTMIGSVLVLDNNRLLLGAALVYYQSTQFGIMETYRPWFIITDTAGNILRDTLYNLQFLRFGYFGEGSIIKDMKGGYCTGGSLNYTPNRDISSLENFPGFIAHLDTNFKITWIDTLHYSKHFQQRGIDNIQQLQNGNYIVSGFVLTVSSSVGGQPSGWTAKFSNDGKMLWQQYHAQDSSGADIIEDVAERTDGSLIFCGAAWNRALPKEHARQDVWLISVDSNGCLQPGCNPNTTDLAIPSIPAANTGHIVVYPNPSMGTLVVQAPANGIFYLYSMLGQQVGNYTVTAGQTNITLPAALPAAVYMGRYKADNSNMAHDVRIVLDR